MSKYWWTIWWTNDNEEVNPLGQFDEYIIWYNIPKLIFKLIPLISYWENYSLTMSKEREG